MSSVDPHTSTTESRGSRTLSRGTGSNLNETVSADLNESSRKNTGTRDSIEPQVSGSLQKSIDTDVSEPPKPTIEDKLDEDFMELLAYIKTNLKNLTDEEDKRRAQAWLQKLCGEALEGVDAKRSRNIYLSRLACQMADPHSNLNPPFLDAPPEGNITTAEVMFGFQPPEEKPPDWLDKLIESGNIPDISHTSRDGRTYLATRTMKGGMGAFGYLAVTLAEDEPLWVGTEDENPLSSSSSKTSTKRKKITTCKGPSLVPPNEPASRLNEERMAWLKAQGKLKNSASKGSIESLLAKRRTQEERDGLLHFYDVLMQSIKEESEVCGCSKGPRNTHIEQLLEKLEKDLRGKGEIACDCEMSSEEKRKYLLGVLYDKTAARKKAVEEREAALDHLEKMFQEENDEEEDADEEIHDDMWNAAADQGPSEHNMKRLLAVYPPELVERFVELLSLWRQDMIRRCRNRHESVVAAMKQDLKAEVKAGLEKYKRARDSWMKVAQALQEVQACQQQAKEDEDLLNLVEDHNTVKQGRSRAKLVSQLMAELNEAQKHFELERTRGQRLRQQLNTEHQRIEDAIQLNEISLEQLQADGEALHNEITGLECDLDEQGERIRELTALYETIC